MREKVTSENTAWMNEPTDLNVLMVCVNRERARGDGAGREPQAETQPLRGAGEVNTAVNTNFSGDGRVTACVLLLWEQLLQAQSNQFDHHVHVEYEWRLRHDDIFDSDDEFEDKVTMTTTYCFFV